MFTCARVAGWSAHILEQHDGAADTALREVRRPTAEVSSRSAVACRPANIARFSRRGGEWSRGRESLAGASRHQTPRTGGVPRAVRHVPSCRAPASLGLGRSRFGGVGGVHPAGGARWVRSRTRRAPASSGHTATAAASTVTGTVSAKRLRVSPRMPVRAPPPRHPLSAALLGVGRPTSAARYRARRPTPSAAPRGLRAGRRRRWPLRRRRDLAPLARGSGALERLQRRRLNAAGGAAAQPFKTYSADQARGVALGQVPDAKLVQARSCTPTPRAAGASHPATLAYAVDVTSTTQADRKLVFVDAASRPGDGHAQPDRVPRRAVCNANGSTTTGGFTAGEGDPGGDDADNAYDWTGATYDYYASNFARQLVRRGPPAGELRALQHQEENTL